MASDANLIKGAGQVAYGAANAIKQQGSGLDALSGAAAKMQQNQLAETKAETAEQKTRNKDLDAKWHENMEATNLSSMNLSEQHYKEVKNAVDGLKMDYDACGFSDEGCKREVMAKMNAQTQRMNQQKDLRAGNKEAYNNGLLSESLTEEEKNIMGIYMNPNASEYTLKYDKDPMEGGQGIYEIANPKYDKNQPESETNKKTIEYTESEITKMFDKQIDVAGKKASSDYGVSLHNDGLNGVEFDENKTKARYDDIISDKSLHSFTHDDMGFGSFKSNFMQPGGPLDEALMIAAKDPNNTYAIEPKDGEQNWYDNIDDEDRKMMFDEIQKNPKLNKDLVKGYYYDMAEKQHANGKKKAEDAALAKKNELIEKRADATLKHNRAVQLKSMKVPTKSEKDQTNRGNIISGITSLGGNISVEDFSSMDGMRFAGGSKGSMGGYVRAINEDGSYDPTGNSGRYGVFSGDPDLNAIREEGGEVTAATAISMLSSDPSKMQSELETLFDGSADAKKINPAYLAWMEAGGEKSGKKPPSQYIEE